MYVFLMCAFVRRVHELYSNIHEINIFYANDTLGHSHKDFNRIRLYHRMRVSLVLMCISVSFLATFAKLQFRQMCIQSHPSFKTVISPAKSTETHTHTQTPIC